MAKADFFEINSAKSVETENFYKQFFIKTAGKFTNMSLGILLALWTIKSQGQDFFSLNSALSLFKVR